MWRLLCLLCWISAASAQFSLDLSWTNGIPSESISISYQYVASDGARDAAVTVNDLPGSTDRYTITVPRAGTYQIEVIGKLAASLGGVSVPVFSDFVTIGSGVLETEAPVTIPPLTIPAATFVQTLDYPNRGEFSSYNIEVERYDPGTDQLTTFQQFSGEQVPFQVTLPADGVFISTLSGVRSNGATKRLGSVVNRDGNAFVPYQSNGLGQPVGNPVSQGDGTFNVVFPLPGLSPELAGKYDSYRLYYKEAGTGIFASASAPISDSTITMSLRPGSYEYYLTAEDSTDGSTAYLGGPGAYTLSAVVPPTAGPSAPPSGPTFNLQILEPQVPRGVPTPLGPYRIDFERFDETTGNFEPYQTYDTASFPYSVPLPAGDYKFVTSGRDTDGIWQPISGRNVNVGGVPQGPYTDLRQLGTSSPVAQPDGSFLINFRPLHTTLPSSYTNYRVRQRPVGSNQYTTVEEPVSTGSIPLSLSPGTYEISLEAVNPTTGDVYFIGGPTYYTLNEPTTIAPRGNSVTVPYPPTARGNLDIVLYEYRSGSWEPADRRVNVPPSSFPVEFTDLPDGNYGVTVQGTGDGIFYGSSMSSFGQSPGTSDPPFGGLGFKFPPPFTGSGIVLLPEVSPETQSRYNNWVVEYTSPSGVTRSVTAPITDSQVEITGLEGGTTYTYRLYLSSPSGQSSPTPPIRLTTPMVVLNTYEVPYPGGATGNLDVYLYRFDFDRNTWVPIDERRNTAQEDFNVFFNDLPNGYYGVVVQGVNGGDINFVGSQSFGQPQDVSNIPSQFGFQIGFLSPFDGSGFLRFPTPSTDQLSRYNEWVLEYGPVGGVSQTIRIPVGDSFRTLTDLTEDTLYMFNLNLDGPSGPSPRTIPYTRRTPIVPTTQTPSFEFQVNLPDLSGLPDNIRRRYRQFGYTIFVWNELTQRFEQTRFSGTELGESDFPQTINLPNGYYLIQYSAEDTNGVTGFGTTVKYNWNFSGQEPIVPILGGGSWVYIQDGTRSTIDITGIGSEVLQQFNQILVTWTSGSGEVTTTRVNLNGPDVSISPPSNVRAGDYRIELTYSNTVTGTTSSTSQPFQITVMEMTPGMKGDPGMPGERGEKGPPGPPGMVGMDGRPGPQGPRGFDGLDGPPGSPGNSGLAGNAGVPGPPGNAGSGVNCLLKGSNNPTACPEEWATGGGFSSVISGTKGPIGPPGPQGVIGSRGDRGPDGPAGSDGSPGDQGSVGSAGPKGPHGIPGPNGPPGRPGKDGLPGSRGPEGATGNAGPVGPPGRQGAKGPDGVRGEKGRRGHTGLEGRPGYDGQKGIRGDRGRTGRVGVHGRDGLPGPLGARGAPGSPGNRGAAGRAGSPGQQGAAGPIGGRGAVGTSGVKGEKGNVGLAGLTGQNGANGRDGQDGRKGAQGNIGRSGTSGSGGGIGIRGIKGSSGTIGEPGAQGAQGVAGPDGHNGRKGAGGDSGRPGAKGDKGETGSVGQSGIPGGPGVAGEVGMQGRTGTQGNRGRLGPIGLPGAYGPSGIRGDLGPLGHKGSTGFNGARGDAGVKGSRGDRGGDGLPGRPGRQGPPGRDGEPGVPGRDGIPATDGKDGRPGPAGPIGDRGDKGTQGPPGDDGPRGDAGENGFPGRDGRNGDKGKKGNAGDVGLPGLSGDIGPQGPKGLQGSDGDPGGPGLNAPAANKGETGPKGFPGDPGVVGAPGRKGGRGQPGAGGLPGVRGDQGPSGEQGGVGNPGPNGAQGAEGLAGLDGDQGTQGPTGPSGPQGSPGQNGQPGIPGIVGDAGVNGNPGPDGPQGDPGALGQKGLPGNGGLPGDGGDIGPEGPQGAQGARGPQGDSGLAGDQGPDGAVGEPGQDGRDGVPGERGPRGDPGLSGPEGPRGRAGTQGSGGTPGFEGPSGGPGPKGAQGAIGTAGQTGPVGPAGPDGVAGSDGQNGVKGDKGPQGVAGPKGYRGDRGTKGPRGRAGSMGTVGIDGQAGMVGEAGSTGEPGATGPTGLTGATGDKGARGGLGAAGDVGETGGAGDNGAVGKPGGPGVEGRPGMRGPVGPTGKDGRPGARGLPGRSGEPGLVGEPGPIGLNGATGPIGPAGRDGVDGLVGANGAPGQPGPDGLPGTGGSAGLPGRPGTQGPIGEPGPVGFDGEDGATGDRGETGTEGLQGPSGLRGEDGVMGPKGERGAVGPIGPAGQPGAPGLDGLSGPDGMRGSPGQDGDSGARGPVGQAGPPGEGWAVSVKGKGKGTGSQHTFYSSELDNFEDIANDFSCYFTPNGSRACPVRCCFDLFQDYPEYQSGYYYTNPGLGSPSEAVVTYCSKEQLKTCVYYDSSNTTTTMPHTSCGCLGDARCKITCSSRPPIASQLKITMADDSQMMSGDIAFESQDNALVMTLSGDASMFPVQSWNLEKVCPGDESASALCDRYCFN